MDKILSCVSNFTNIIYEKYIVHVFMWPKFGNSSISRKEIIITSIVKGLDQKSNVFEVWSCFKFTNFRLALGMPLKRYTSFVKVLKLQSRKVSRIILTFVEVTGENWWGGILCPFILHWVMRKLWVFLK